MATEPKELNPLKVRVMREAGSEEEVLAAFRHVRDEIRSRVRQLFASNTVKPLRSKRS